MDNLQPGDTISNKYGTRRVIDVLPNSVLLGQKGASDIADQFYTINQLKFAGYELTLNDEQKRLPEDRLRERILEQLYNVANYYVKEENAASYEGVDKALDNILNLINGDVSLERKDND